METGDAAVIAASLLLAIASFLVVFMLYPWTTSSEELARTDQPDKLPGSIHALLISRVRRLSKLANAPSKLSLKTSFPALCDSRFNFLPSP